MTWFYGMLVIGAMVFVVGDSFLMRSHFYVALVQSKASS